MPSTPSSSETQERLSTLLQATRDRQSRNLDQLRRNIEAAESPVEGTSPRSPMLRSTPTQEPDMETGRERQRIAQVRASLPPVKPGQNDWGASVVDRVRARYDDLRRGR